MQQLLDTLWHDYSTLNPDASYIWEAFNGPSNDHIAFRTFQGIEKIRRVFEPHGYELGGEYDFEEKKLKAIHLEYKKKGPSRPRIFISQMKLDYFDKHLRRILNELETYVPETPVLPSRPWPAIAHHVYQDLLAESEYAAWVAAWGLRANHFTIDVSSVVPALLGIDDDPGGTACIEDMNAVLKKSGYKLNSSGGEIKGSEEQGLKQSSTVARTIMCTFERGMQFPIKGAYYEFAERFNNFNGFITKSADKIFESTNG